MKINKLPAIVIVALFGLNACNSTPPTASNTNASNANGASANAPAPLAQNGNSAGVAPAHGAPNSPTAPASSVPASGGEPKTEFDSKIEKAEAKAKLPNASAADKKAAAAAYLERANYFRDAGQPQLYKYALGDYRRVLKYQPDNAEAKAKMDEIVSIYQSMGRSVPTNGLEQ